LEHITELVGDPVDFVDALYLIVKPQADKAGVTDEAFGELLVGDIFENATTAFVEALVDFFPSRQRRILRTLLTKARAEQEAAMTEAEKMLTSTDSVLSTPL
jgi:hypothetical protein